MAPALSGARGLFSVLKDALSKADKNRVRVTRRVWDVVADFRAIADSLATRPTGFRELVPTSPVYIGASDACSPGMEGVWFHSTDTTKPPLVWHLAFTKDVTNALVTASNPHGTISISDLELLAMIAHKDIVAHNADVCERTLCMAVHRQPGCPRLV